MSKSFRNHHQLWKAAHCVSGSHCDHISVLIVYNCQVIQGQNALTVFITQNAENVISIGSYEYPFTVKMNHHA